MEQPRIQTPPGAHAPEGEKQAASAYLEYLSLAAATFIYMSEIKSRSPDTWQEEVDKVLSSARDTRVSKSREARASNNPNWCPSSDVKHLLRKYLKDPAREDTSSHVRQQAEITIRKDLSRHTALAGLTEHLAKLLDKLYDPEGKVQHQFKALVQHSTMPDLLVYTRVYYTTFEWTALWINNYYDIAAVESNPSDTAPAQCSSPGQSSSPMDRHNVLEPSNTRQNAPPCERTSKHPDTAGSTTSGLEENVIPGVGKTVQREPNEKIGDDVDFETYPPQPGQSISDGEEPQTVAPRTLTPRSRQARRNWMRKVMAAQMDPLFRDPSRPTPKTPPPKSPTPSSPRTIAGDDDNDATEGHWAPDTDVKPVVEHSIRVSALEDLQHLFRSSSKGTQLRVGLDECLAVPVHGECFQLGSRNYNLKDYRFVRTAAHRPTHDCVLLYHAEPLRHLATSAATPGVWGNPKVEKLDNASAQMPELESEIDDLLITPECNEMIATLDIRTCAKVVHGHYSGSDWNSGGRFTQIMATLVTMVSQPRDLLKENAHRSTSNYLVVVVDFQSRLLAGNQDDARSTNMSELKAYVLFEGEVLEIPYACTFRTYVRYACTVLYRHVLPRDKVQSSIDAWADRLSSQSGHTAEEAKEELRFLEILGQADLRLKRSKTWKHVKQILRKNIGPTRTTRSTQVKEDGKSFS